VLHPEALTGQATRQFGRGGVVARAHVGRDQHDRPRRGIARTGARPRRNGDGLRSGDRLRRRRGQRQP